MRDQDRNLLASGALFGLLAVALGAFGAHALRARLTPSELATFETAVRYQSTHALAIFAAVWWAQQGGRGLARIGAVAFVVGVVLFSGSLYGLVLLHWNWLGPITPLGGLFLMAGWALVLGSVLRGR